MPILGSLPRTEETSNGFFYFDRLPSERRIASALFFLYFRRDMLLAYFVSGDPFSL